MKMKKIALDPPMVTTTLLLHVPTERNLSPCMGELNKKDQIAVPPSPLLLGSVFHNSITFKSRRIGSSDEQTSVKCRTASITPLHATQYLRNFL